MSKVFYRAIRSSATQAYTPKGLTGETNTHFRMTTFFINCSRRDATIVMRSGMAVSSPGKKDRHSFTDGSFTIRRIYDITGIDAITSMMSDMETLSINDGIKSPDLVLIYEAIKAERQRLTSNNEFRVVIDNKFNLESQPKDFCLFVENDDILINEGINSVRRPHPHSVVGRSFTKTEEVFEENEVTGFFIDLIDNEQTVPRRYMFAAGRVIEIPAKKDMLRESGVYYTYGTKAVTSDLSSVMEYCTIEDAQEQFGLYATQEEARSAGDPNLTLKNQEKELNFEMLERKRQYEEDKHRWDTELAKMKGENEQLKEQISAAALVRDDESQEKKQKREEYYETRSYERKDSHELIKFIPAFLIGLFGAIAILRK